MPVTVIKFTVAGILLVYITQSAFYESNLLGATISFSSSIDIIAFW